LYEDVLKALPIAMGTSKYISLSFLSFVEERRTLTVPSSTMSLVACVRTTTCAQSAPLPVQVTIEDLRSNATEGWLASSSFKDHSVKIEQFLYD
jgi:hypothetical protein